jgi:ABC-2 type transport system ATP-binding protein
MTQAAALAELRAVRKQFGDQRAVDDLTLEIRPGEVFGLLGPNGAGKTTCVRLLCGLLVPDSGEVRIAGLDPRLQPLEARRRLAYVPDGAPLYANLTPRQHLALVGRLHGLEEGRIDADSSRMLDALELGGRANDPVGDFSHGMRQKVALACALLPRPSLLVLDEPLSGLDVETTAVFKEVLRAWAEGGRSVLYTSHLLDVVERVCDRMAILDRGKLVAVGTLEQLRAKTQSGGTLEQVFQALTRSENPRERARRVLGV